MSPEGNQAYELGFRSVGQDVVVWPHARVIGAENITLGDSVSVDDFSMIIAREPMRFGSFVHVATGVSVLGGGTLVMEDFSGLSGGVRVYTGNDDYLGAGLTGPTVPISYRAITRSAVRVGRHCVIGANSVVLPGVSIGEGATVGALSLVNQDLEPWTVYGGVPARPLRARPRERVLELELQLRDEAYDAHGRFIPKDRRTS
jgi:acetyltransferase-like isoleucine patch superfamily enzyme